MKMNESRQAQHSRSVAEVLRTLLTLAGATKT
jgi:hypothetical protein